MNNKLLISSIFIVIVGLFLAYNCITYRSPSHKELPRLDHQIKHLALIMDGNRRWAHKQGFKPWIGHKKGVDPLKASLEFCLEQNIPYLSVYAFSLENFKRSAEELSYLFDVLAQELAATEFENLLKHNIKVVFVGDRTQFPQQLVSIINDIERKSAQNTRLVLNILFCYGGQQEIVQATQKIAQLVQEKKLTPDQITSELFESYLWSAGTPPPDLIIRTAGDHRLSNLFCYQSAYSELYFINCYWPDITKQHLYDIIKDFIQTKRRFGA
ncbi:MAG: polyprenyl diphosphate synthase [Candidatus Babeliaceae bacterium]